jgi:transposase
MENTFTSKLFIGIDVHKRQWSISIYTSAIHHRTFSQPPEPKALKCYLDKHFDGYQVVCAYEACKFGFIMLLPDMGINVRLLIRLISLPPTKKQLKRQILDSRKIAKALRGGMLRSIHVPAIETQGDRHLFRYRKKIWTDLVRLKNRIKDKLLFSGVSLAAKYDNSFWTKAFLVWLEQVELPSKNSGLTLDFLLEQYKFTYSHFLKVSIEVRRLQKKTGYKEYAKLLRDIPGIGPLTTVKLLTEPEDIDRFKNFIDFNSYIGLKPLTHSGGEADRKGHMNYRGHHGLRSSLIECARSSVQKDPAMLKREELRAKHTGKRAIVIIARKLLSRIYHVLKTKELCVLGVIR